MRFLQFILPLTLIACSQSPKYTHSDIIEGTLSKYEKQLEKRSDVQLKKIIYYNQTSEEKLFSDVNWNTEFALFSKYNLTHIEKKGDLIFDTVFDERTNRYLLRGMRLENGDGIQSMYLVLDSQRNLIQLNIKDKLHSWFSSSSKELFWDAKGEYSYIEQSKNRFTQNEEIKIFAEWQ